MNIKKILVFTSLMFITVFYNNCGFFQSSSVLVGEGSFSSVADDLIDEGNPNNPIDSTPTANQSTPAATAPQAAAKLGANFSSGYRVLTRAEIQKSLELIFSTSFNEITTEKLIPDLSEEIFDNTQFNSGFSQTHFIGLGRVADLVEQKLTANNSKILLDNFPCLSQGGEACRHEVINFFVPLFLRRPITDEQFATYDSFVGNFERKMNNKILDRVPMFLAALTQSTSFIIRREVGTENGNAFALSPYEVASRLSFFITGAGPDIELLNAAKNNQLSTEEERLTQANRLLNSDRGKAHVVDINKELFRIDDVNAPDAIRDSLIRESELLIEDIVFNKKLAWKNLFSADGTFVNRALASHYKMTAPGGNNFVYTKYPDNDRSGILSHGAFLSHGYAGEPENTSPIRRGLQIVEDLLCRHLPLPSAIDIDNDPAGDHPNECNIQARKLTTLAPGGQCTACHTFMEPLGLAFERFNLLGQYRTTEKDRPQCTTIEPGLLTGVQFSSIKELGSLMKTETDLDSCLVSRMSEYAFAAELDPGHVTSIYNDLSNFKNDKKLTSLILDLVASPQFVRRDK